MQVAIVVDQLDGAVVNFDFLMEDANETVVANLLDAMEKFRLFPKEIKVYKSNLYGLIKGMSKLFGFEI